jgi:peptidoglycan hydrolase-like protein with peptidoglycan-binding domain
MSGADLHCSRRSSVKKLALLSLAIAGAVGFAVAAPGAAPAYAAVPEDAAAAGAQMVAATPTLIREIQFMLQAVGIDPGPIDGNAQALTNRAVRQFQQRNGLPPADIVNGGTISTAFIDLLRRQVAASLTKGAAPEAPAAPAPAPAPAATVTAPVAPPPPPPDPFASCAASADDFRVGTKQYNPQSYLDEGFGGSTSRAVTSLRQRLDEARDIAEKIGGNALLEVQRQARVLSYYECRQKIEQASAAPK